MPGKMARSAPRPPFGLPEVLGSRPHLASVLQEGRKNANIHARSGVIRGIPVETLAQAARPVDDDDWGSDRQVEAENLFFDAVCRELSNEQIIELEEPIRTETDMA